MKSLNHKEINQAFTRFLTWFASLLLVITACVYTYFETGEHYLSLLSEQKNEFERAFSADAMLADKVDSLYAYMSLLNTNRIQDDRQMQRLITRKKEELAKLVNQQLNQSSGKKDYQGYFAVYNRLSGHINEMLLLKDSLNRAMVDEGDLRQELTDCLRRSIEVDRQRKRRGAGAF